MPTTGGITALRNSVPLKDALVVERLKKEGAIILAKANLFELAGTLNPPDESSEMGGICHNPFDLTKTCGGSSSGTGAGIASGMAIIGFGTDTGGSVVVPSSFNNLFGLRSPYNAPKLDGIIPTFQRADTIGPMTVYLDDMVLAYSVINADPTFYDTYKTQIIAPNSLTVTVFADLMTSYKFESGITFEPDSEVKAAFDSHIELLKRLNVNVNLIPAKEPLLANLGTLLVTMFAEGCGNWCYKFYFSQYFNDSSRFDFDAPYHNYDEFIENPKLLTKEAIEVFQLLNVNGSGESFCAQKCESYDFLQQNLTNLLEDTSKLGDYDAILMPTYAKLPYSKLQDLSPTDINNLIHISANSGVPAMNLPAEFSNKTGLPIGMMLIGRTKRFNRMLEIAKLVENAKTLARLPKNTPILRDLVESECGASKTAGSIFLLKNNLTFYLILIVFLIKKF
jgi:amidase